MMLALVVVCSAPTAGAKFVGASIARAPRYLAPSPPIVNQGNASVVQVGQYDCRAACVAASCEQFIFAGDQLGGLYILSAAR